MKKSLICAGLGLILLASCSSSMKKNKATSVSEEVVTTSPYSKTIEADQLQLLITEWPESSREAISSMIEKYGMPDESSHARVIWNNTAPFKRSIVYREVTAHEFPKQHEDVLEQTIDYRVPDDRLQVLAQFNGSLIVDKTKGELSSRGNREEMNILALNLADQVVRAEMKVNEARKQFANSVSSYEMGNKNQFVSGLLIMHEEGTSNPDRAVHPGLFKETMQAQEAEKE